MFQQAGEHKATAVLALDAGFSWTTLLCLEFASRKFAVDLKVFCLQTLCVF